MKQFLLCLFFFSTIYSMQPFYFTVASFNVYHLDNGISGFPTYNISKKKLNKFKGLLKGTYKFDGDTIDAEAPSVHPDNHGDYSALLLKDMDIMCFQEWPSQADFNNTSANNFNNEVFPDTHYHKIYGSGNNLKNQLIRYTVINKEKFTLIQTSEIKNSVDKSRPSLVVILSVKNAPTIKIGVVNVHFAGGKNSRKEQANDIKRYINGQKDTPYWIICGDFNMDIYYNDVQTIFGYDDSLHGVCIPTEVTDRCLDYIFYSPTITLNGTAQFPQPTNEHPISVWVNNKWWMSDHAIINAKFKIEIPTTTSHTMPPIAPINTDKNTHLIQLAEALETLHNNARFSYKGITITVERGDILKTQADAIVNAANTACLGGGGIDGVITSAGGGVEKQKRDLLPEKNGIRCPEGDARLTISGDIKNTYNIPYVLHAVGPRCPDPLQDQKLKGAFYNSLKTAADYNLYLLDRNNYGHAEFKNVTNYGPITSLAIPAISVGIFGCPEISVATQAANAIKEFAELDKKFQTIRTIKFMILSPTDKKREQEIYNAFVSAFTLNK